MIDPTTQLPADQQPEYPDPEEDQETDENGKPIEVESEFNDKLFTELPGVQAGSSGAVGGQAQGAGKLTSTEKSRLGTMEQELGDLIRQSRETHSRLVEIADEQ